MLNGIQIARVNQFQQCLVLQCQFFRMATVRPVKIGAGIASSNNDPRQPVNAELNLMKLAPSSEMLEDNTLVPYFNSSSDSPDFLMNALLFLSGTSFQIPSFSK